MTAFLMLRHVCTEGLRFEALQAKIRRGVSLGSADTWPEFYALLRGESGVSWTSAPPASVTSYGGPASSGVNATPASLGRRGGRAQGQDRIRLPNDEYDKRKQQGLCFTCGKRGVARECPNHAFSSIPSSAGNGGTGDGR